MKKWFGNKPEDCNFCKRKWREGIGETFVDGATIQGPWAIMCVPCHLLFGLGYGEGIAQAYNFDTSEKIERPDVFFLRNVHNTEAKCPDGKTHEWFDLSAEFRECQRCGERVRKRGTQA